MSGLRVYQDFGGNELALPNGLTGRGTLILSSSGATKAP